MGVAKAGGGRQQEQEGSGWRLAMKEDGCCPVMTHRDDGAPPGGEGETQRQGLFCHCRRRWAGIAARGGQEATAKQRARGTQR
jgi:hypothetical protein